MRSSITLLVIILSLFFFGCSNEATQTVTPAPSLLTDSPEIQINFDEKSINKSDYAIYVLLAKYNGNWKVVSISDDKQRVAKGQERLKYTFSKGPETSFDKDDSWFYQNGYKCKSKGFTGAYTPCRSSFTSFKGTDFFFIAGNSRYALDAKKIGQAAAESGASRLVTEYLNKLQHIYTQNLATNEQCVARTKQKLDELKKNIIVQNTTKNIPGYDNIFKFSYEISDRYTKIICGKPIEEYTFTIFPKKDDTYNIGVKFEPDVQSVSVTETKPVSFVTEITSVQFDNLYFNDSFTENGLTITLKTLKTSMGSRPKLYIKISNDTNKYQEISYLTFSIDDKACTKSYKLAPIVIPPDASKDDFEIAVTCENMDAYVYNLLKGQITKKESDNIILNYGLSVQSSEITKTFYNKATLTDLFFR